MNQSTVVVTGSRNAQLVFDNALIVEHDAAAAAGVKEPPH